jgi:hypothetical protein
VQKTAISFGSIVTPTVGYNPYLSATTAYITMFEKKAAQDYSTVNLDDFSDDSSDDDEDFVQKSIRNQQVRTLEMS